MRFAMKLDRWRRGQGLSIQALADKLESTHQVASRYCNGTRIPVPPMMGRIYVLTHGQVTPNDFYDLPKLGSAPSSAAATGAGTAP